MEQEITVVFGYLSIKICDDTIKFFAATDLDWVSEVVA